MLKWTLIFFLICGAFAGGVFEYGRTQYYDNGPLPEEKLILIPKGASLNLIAKKLEQENVITNRYLFIIATRLQGHENHLKAGEYLIPAHYSAHNVLQKMEKGDVFVRQYTVPEGYSAAQIVTLLNGINSLAGMLTDIPAEGSLLPETYRYEFEDSKTAQIAQMQSAMQKTLDEAWGNRAADLPIKTKEEALILASIIEKETGIAAERARIAGVFINRLKINMPLQTDPSVIYAITEGKAPLGRALLRRDLGFNSPYNTYRHAGLPPGPICNPGKAAIEAALHPESHNFYYFVADGSGGHVFAKSLSEHNSNVQNWRKIQRSK